MNHLGIIFSMMEYHFEEDRSVRSNYTYHYKDKFWGACWKIIKTFNKTVQRVLTAVYDSVIKSKKIGSYSILQLLQREIYITMRTYLSMW